MSDPLYGSLRRRQEASRPLQPLTCGCKDPLFCDCWPPASDPPPLSEVMVDGAVAAAHHLRAENLPPIFDRATVSAMRRRGYRRLAEELAAGDAA
jgi:hypothetical protein